MAARVARRAARGEAIDPADTPYQTEQDAWQRQLWRECGLAIGRWLEQRGRLDQPIAALQLRELEGMAWACIARYTDLREARHIELSLAPHGDPLKPDPLDLMLGV